MYVARKETAPNRSLEGLVSHVLLQEGDIENTNLAVTWVEIEPGAKQVAHSHPPQQIYVVIRGSGRMIVGDEETELTPGDLALIPSGVRHSIENREDETLTYVSASSPAFRITDVYDSGELTTPSP